MVKGVGFVFGAAFVVEFVGIFWRGSLRRFCCVEAPRLDIDDAVFRVF